MRRISKKIGLILLVAVGIMVLFLSGLALYLSRIRVADIKKQAEHIGVLHTLYDKLYVPVEEQKFVNFDLADNSLRLNEIQLLATHNSYKKMGSAIPKFLVGLVDRAEAKAMKYEYNSLTDQLNHGVRSFELDLRCRAGDLEVIHAPLADNSSTCPRFDLALEEILLWSEHNPGHIPLLFLMELKGDWMFLDPASCDFTGSELALIDRLINEYFGEKLFSPGDMVAPGRTLKQAVREKGWPRLKELRGKVIFILHPGEYTDSYVELDPSFTAMAMFPAALDTALENSYASFIVHNEPRVKTINELVSKNYIVRTRLDSGLVIDENRFEKGLASGAQILTTDYGPNHNFEHTDYVSYLDDKYLVIANSYLAD